MPELIVNARTCTCCGLCAGRFRALGVGDRDIRIVLYELPKDNWGIRGGVPASEVDLGFKVEV